MSHKICNWSEYNQSLINRGSINFWIPLPLARPSTGTSSPVLRAGLRWPRTLGNSFDFSSRRNPNFWIPLRWLALRLGLRLRSSGPVSAGFARSATSPTSRPDGIQTFGFLSAGSPSGGDFVSCPPGRSPPASQAQQRLRLLVPTQHKLLCCSPSINNKAKKADAFLALLFMLGAGLEPARDYSQEILSLLCLPFHHPSRKKPVLIC